MIPLQSAAAVTQGQQTGTIAPFIAKQLAALTAPDVNSSVAVARQSLFLGCPRLGNLPNMSSPAYANAYSTEFSLAAIKILSGTTATVPVKINIGIVAEKIANNGQSVQLIPLVQKLLGDRTDAVVYWGCKAAKPMVLSLLLQDKFSGTSPLFGDLVKAVGNHSAGDMGGLIAVEAYKALVVNPTTVPSMKPEQMKPRLAPLYDPLLDLLKLRTSMYAKGIVPSPDAEANVPTLLTTSTPPPIYTEKQKAKAVQELVDLIEFAGQRAASATPQQAVQLRVTVGNAASALNVFTGTSNFSKLNPMPMGVTGPQIATLIKNVAVAKTAQLTFSYVKEPPTLPAIAPPAAPPAPTNAAAGS